MSAKRWKWLAAAVLLLGALALAAILYRDAIGRRIVNAALEDSEYSVSELSVGSLTFDQLLLSELVLDRRDGARIAVEGVTLPVDLSSRRLELLSVDRAVYTPAERDERQASYSELAQLALGAHRLFPGVEVRVAELQTPWLPDLTEVVWRSSAESQTASFDVDEFSVSVSATEGVDVDYDVSARISEALGDHALLLTAEASVVEGDVLVSAEAELELGPWLDVLHALGAVPEDVKALQGDVDGTFGIVVPWEIERQIVFSGSVASDDSVDIAYARNADSVLEIAAVSDPEVIWLFQYPSLEWSATAAAATVTSRSDDLGALSLELADVDCRSGIRCEFTASYRDDALEGEIWSAASLTATARLALAFTERLTLRTTRRAVVRLEGIDVADHALEALELVGDIALDEDRIVSEMEISGVAGAKGRLLASHDLDTGTGSLELQDSSLAFEVSRASKLVREWPYPWDILGGELRFEGQADWRVGNGDIRYSGLAHAELAGLAGAYGELAFRGLDGAVSMAFDTQSGASVQPIDMTVQLFDIGFPLEGIRATLRPDLDERAVEISGLTMRALGGTITAEPFVYSTRADSNRVVMGLNGIQLQLMVDLLKSDGLMVAGSVSGKLPVSISAAGVTIEGGRLDSDPPGGVIRNRLPIPGPQGDPRLSIVRRALANFEFDALSSDVSYAAGGDLVMNMKISGTNPEVDPDQPVVVNLGLENNLPELMRSLQAARSINDILSRKLTN